MNLKTCLLVTDDPDDHQAFSEALSEISNNTILIVILDSQKAALLLKTKKHIPDYIFMDLSMHGIQISDFITVRLDPDIGRIPAFLYGDREDLEKIQNPESLPFFSKDFNYAELRNYLTEVLQSKIS